jgi:hypothetical protein
VIASLSPLDCDLILAAFSRDRAAVEAWRRWRDAIDWDGHLGRDQFALLPRLHQNLTDLGVEDDLLPRFKGVRRQAWYANQRKIADLGPTLAGLAAAGAEALVLPPTALLALDQTAIVVGGVDLVCAVRRDAADAGLRSLHAQGWRPTGLRLPPFLLTGMALALDRAWWRDGSGRVLEVLGEGNGRGLGLVLPGEVWPRTRRRQFGQVRVRCLDATDTIHFLLRTPPAADPFGQVATLLWAIAAGERPDWWRLQEQTRTMPAAPGWVAHLAALEAILGQLGAPAHFRLHYGDGMPDRAPAMAATGLAGRVGQHWAAYRAAWGARYSPGAAVLNLPGYLMAKWRLPRWRALPMRMLRGARADWRAVRRARIGHEPGGSGPS